MARTSIQSKLSKNKVAKLYYTVRGPYQIIHITICGSYFVWKVDKSDSLELKFTAYYLYPLLHSLKSCELVDTIDTRYMNQTHISLVIP